MSSGLFEVVEHTSPCQHIREYPRGTKLRQEDALHLAIKQYKPLDDLEPADDAVTIIAAHAIAFPKEAYEPLWDDILRSSKQHGFTIRSIWIADMSNQGASGILNEQAQGDDRMPASYFDHARDLLHMINLFREHMPRPIIGIGHSIGALELVALSVMHPRIFTTLILMEPMIQREVPPGPNAAMASSHRIDIWPSFAAAEAAFRKSKFFARFDSRALDNVIRYGLRRIPTAVHPLSATATDLSFTLATTKHQEVWSFLRPNFEPRPALGDHDITPSRLDRLLSPDVDVDLDGNYLFYRPELRIAFGYLPFLRPNVLYLFGAKSIVSTAKLQAEKMEHTGVGLGGSGGVRHGQVEKHVFEDRGHMLPFEDVAGCASLVAEWLGKQLRQFKVDEDFLGKHPSGKSDRDMLVVSEKWMELVRAPSTATRPVKEKL